MSKKIWLPDNWGEIKMADRIMAKEDQVPFEDFVFLVKVEIARDETGKWYWRKVSEVNDK